MPKWGLTESQRAAQPWGLDADLLSPSKTITDPVHGDVHVMKIERLMMDSPPMQRLRRVRQLGTTHLVYPAATHSRFSHALGTMRAAQDLLDAVADNRRGPRHVADLIDEWEEQDPAVAGLEDNVSVADARFAEATVLARLGGLMHDLCHVPLGHTIEDDLKVLVPHDRNRSRFDAMWEQLDEEARDAIEEARSLFPDATLTLKEELEMLILSKERAEGGGPDSHLHEPEESSYPFVGDIVGNTICADLIDYLQRDHVFTGLPMAIGKRFMDDFYVMGSSHRHFARKMVVRISRYGHPREDVITELVKYLRYRYELTERVLTHHAKIAADAMIGKLLEMWSDAVWIEEATDRYGARLGRVSRDGDVDAFKRAVFRVDARRAGASTLQPTSTDDPDLNRSLAVAEIDDRVRARVEEVFVRHSDDGLLEHLVQLGRSSGGRRYSAVAELADAVMNRMLYKLIARADSPADRALAWEKYEKFGKPSERRRVEESALTFAGLSQGWRVVVWLPNPDMRLKVAEVLVDDGQSVAPLDRVADAGGHIVDQHQRLWGVSIYAAPDVVEKAHATHAVLMKLKGEMDIALVDADSKMVPTAQEHALRVVGDRGRLSSDSREHLRELNETLQVAAAGATGTFREQLDALWRLGRENGIPGLTGRPPRDLW